MSTNRVNLEYKPLKFVDQGFDTQSDTDGSDTEGSEYESKEESSGELELDLGGTLNSEAETESKSLCADTLQIPFRAVYKTTICLAPLYTIMPPYFPSLNLEAYIINTGTPVALFTLFNYVESINSPQVNESYLARCMRGAKSLGFNAAGLLMSIGSGALVAYSQPFEYQVNQTHWVGLEKLEDAITNPVSSIPLLGLVGLTAGALPIILLKYIDQKCQNRKPEVQVEYDLDLILPVPEIKKPSTGMKFIGFLLDNGIQVITPVALAEMIYFNLKSVNQHAVLNIPLAEVALVASAHLYLRAVNYVAYDSAPVDSWLALEPVCGQKHSNRHLDESTRKRCRIPVGVKAIAKQVALVTFGFTVMAATFASQCVHLNTNNITQSNISGCNDILFSNSSTHNVGPFFNASDTQSRLATGVLTMVVTLATPVVTKTVSAFYNLGRHCLGLWSRNTEEYQSITETLEDNRVHGMY